MADFSRETWEKKVNEIMDYFNFNKVWKVMQFLKWKWAHTSLDCVGDLRAAVRKELMDVYRQFLTHQDDRFVATGGFEYEVEVHDEYPGGYQISVMFVVQSWNA
jgi:hypothetical protein